MGSVCSCVDWGADELSLSVVGEVVVEVMDLLFREVVGDRMTNSVWGGNGR